MDDQGRPLRGEAQGSEVGNKTIPKRYHFDIKKISSQRPASISIFNGKGIRIEAPSIGNRINHGRGERGKITGWSKASRRRMREAFIKYAPPDDYKAYAVTLTVPGPILTAAENKTLWKNFARSIDERGISAIWRVEIQKRGALHWHALMFAPDEISMRLKKGGRTMTVPAQYAIDETWSMCVESLGPVYFDPPYFGPNGTWKQGIISTKSRMGLPNAHFRACVIESGNAESGSWARYMQDHASKAKQEQIPEDIGRHWGVIGRSRLKSRFPDEVCSLEDNQFFFVIRSLQRLATPMMKQPKHPFGTVKGYRINRGSIGSSVWFTKTETVKRLIDYATQNIWLTVRK